MKRGRSQAWQLSDGPGRGRGERLWRYRGGGHVSVCSSLITADVAGALMASLRYCFDLFSLEVSPTPFLRFSSPFWKNSQPFSLKWKQRVLVSENDTLLCNSFCVQLTELARKRGAGTSHVTWKGLHGHEMIGDHGKTINFHVWSFHVKWG